VRFTGLKMPLQKVLFKPGVNRENTRYTNEGGWYESDKIRFRQGTPEVIGGWQRISGYTYNGVCRSLWNWVTLANQNLVGVGTNTKFYIEQGGYYNDITPIRASSTINNNPFALTASTTVTVTDTAHGATTGSFVTYSGATAIGGAGTNVTAAVLNKEFQVTVIDANSYTIVLSVTPNATAIAGSPGGGASVVAAYQVNAGPAFAIPLTGWGAGSWGAGTWGYGSTPTSNLQLWSQINFGQNLIFGPRGGGVYYWNANSGVTTRGVNLTTLGDAQTPVVQNSLTVSDASRFVIVFGTNDPNATNPTAIDPMFVRWSDQEDPFTWIPSATNQAGSLRLSHGSQIVTTVQTRQEIVIFTDSSVYSMQYLGPPYVWGSQLLGDNISIISPNAAVIGSGVIYWMGVDKFYMYDGRVQTLNCDLRRYVFLDLNQEQAQQVFCSTNEGFNEVWWFYCSGNSNLIDKYVIYNYLENVWYYGTMSRTAWLDSGLRAYPLAAAYNSTTSTGNLINHEQGLNDDATDTTVAIDAYISSSEFDIGDGHNFGFVWRMLPDLTFQNSTNSPTGQVPTLTMTLYGLANSGSGATSSAGANVASSSTYVITEQFTGEIFTRLRGRQMILKIESNQINTAFQVGATRIDIRPDGRR
jgi:hypothetical protein